MPFTSHTGHEYWSFYVGLNIYRDVYTISQDYRLPFDPHSLTNGPFTITSFWGGKVSIKWRKYMEAYAFMYCNNRKTRKHVSM